MNPKSVKDLDPKLKEAYERIMGSNFTPKSAQTQPANPTNSQPQPEQKASEPSQAPVPAQNTPIMQTTQVFNQNPQPLEPVPSSNEKEEKKETKAELDPTSLFTSSPSTTSTTQKKSLNMLPLLFAIGAILFFGAYVVIWAKVFGLF